MSQFSTPQEEFWAGEFGNKYLERNVGDDLVTANLILFGNILRRLPRIDSILELGCNIGLNLEALKKINDRFSLSGVEINNDAVAIAREKKIANIVHGSIVEKLSIDPTFDLTFTKTVLIHIHPESLVKVYDNLYDLSKRYIMVCEYYNPSPVSVTYRGHTNRERMHAQQLSELGLRES